MLKKVAISKGGAVKNRFFPLVIPLFLVAFLLLQSSVVSAENRLLETSFPENGSLEQALIIEKALKQEKAGLEGLVSRTEKHQKDLTLQRSEISAYKIQLSILSNQLHQVETTPRELEKTLADSEMIRDHLALRQAVFEEELRSITAIHKRNQDQIEANKKNLADLPGEEFLGEPEKKMKLMLMQLQDVLFEKNTILENLSGKVSNHTQELSAMLGQYAALTGNLENRIREVKKTELLRRQASPLIREVWGRIGNDFREFLDLLHSLGTYSFWRNIMFFWGASDLLGLISFVLVVLMAMFFTHSLKIRLTRIIGLPGLKDKFWNRTFLELVRKKRAITVGTIFLSICVLNDLFFKYPPWMRWGVDLLLFLMVMAWCRELLMSLRFSQVESFFTTQKRLIWLLQIIRISGTAYVCMENGLSQGNSILVSFRIVCEIILYLWVFFFWRLSMGEGTPTLKGNSMVMKMVRPLSFAIPGAGLIMELAGYGTLTYFWFLSWGKTLAALFISAFFFWMIREWQAMTPVPGDANFKEDGKRQSPLLWMLVQILWLAWFLALFLSVLFAWGSWETVFSGLVETLTFTFRMGAISFSILSFINACLVLLLTHMVVRVWRHVFMKMVLLRSGLDKGMQESMTTITVYVIWIFGIFVALQVFGLNTTTLAVAFGALGIGLGFGLQNIFNNFISGIILLFERPIQVGDNIEINGVWGTIKKTNVRSTTVQTYDNATIIIPNSDLISNQVVNWSFKDKRLRRSIQVGVAYGSDIGLVKTTLLEIADNVSRVLSYPKPEVVFKDFGDSSLVFSLRIWTYIDNFYGVETDIRFQIDHQFKNRGIEIAFPQNDIHIRSVDPEIWGQLSNFDDQEKE